MFASLKYLNYSTAVCWSTIIKELVDSGLTQTQIGKIVGRTQSVIADLKNGKIREPSYSSGCALLELHAIQTRKK